jgi:hypothetical protein
MCTKSLANILLYAATASAYHGRALFGVAALVDYANSCARIVVSVLRCNAATVSIHASFVELMAVVLCAVASSLAATHLLCDMAAVEGLNSPFTLEG